MARPGLIASLVGAGVLVRLGIHTLGDLAALPRPAVTSRFGPDGEWAHRLASGLPGRPPATRPPGDDLAVDVEFDPPIGQSEPAVFAAIPLATRMHQGLESRGLTCERIEIEVTTIDGWVGTRMWRHGGRLTSRAVADRVRWQLDAWRTTGQLTAPITRLRLTPDQLVDDTGHQLTLWGGPTDADEKADRAAARLQAMLGPTAVTVPRLAGGRGPGEHVAVVPWGEDAGPDQRGDQPWPGHLPAPSPATIHPRPLPVDLLDRRGQPVMVTARATMPAPPARLILPSGDTLTVIAWSTPWPVTDHWWDATQQRRIARLQLVTDDGRARLVFVHDARWAIEAEYP